MFSLFTKSNSAINVETPLPKIRNRDLPWQLRQPSLWERLKRKTFYFLKVFILSGVCLYVVIMSFGDGTRAKRTLENFSIADTWHATVALKQKIFNDKVDSGNKSGKPDI
jgi:hypothetical protein